MKILFLTHYDTMYGANKALLSLMLSLKKSGQDVYLVIPAEGEMTRRLAKEGIPYIVSGVTSWEAPIGTPVTFLRKKSIRKKSIEAELAYIHSQTKELGIEVVHSNSSVIGTGAMLAELLGAKHVWHIREYGKEHFSMHYFYPEKVVKKYYEEAAAVLTISEALKENIKGKYPDAKVRRIYDGITLEKEPVLNRLSKEDGIIRFVYLGYLFPMKHQMDVLKATKILKEQGIRNFQISFAGSGKSFYTEQLKRYKEKHHLSMVHFLGYVEKPYEILEKSDVGIIASEYEGFGLVTVEYMLHSMPVIGRRSGATPELVVNQETGLLYDTVEELAESMKRLIQEENQRLALGEKGRVRALEFSEEKNVEEVLSVYNELG